MTRRFVIPSELLSAFLALTFFAVAPVRAHDDHAREAEAALNPQKAQPRPERDARKEKSDGPMATPELRDETFRLMDAYLISNLQESLGLTDDQFTKALPLVKRLQGDRRESAMRRFKALRMLRRTLNSGSATEAGVADLLKELKTAVTEERASAARNIDALDAILSPLQQAKYRVFEAEVDSRLRHLLARTQDRDKPPNR